MASETFYMKLSQKSLEASDHGSGHLIVILRMERNFTIHKRSVFQGVHCQNSRFLQIFTPEEMISIEAKADGLDRDAREGFLPEQCFHNSSNRAGVLKRTKFFFGARCEESDPINLFSVMSDIGAFGVLVACACLDMAFCQTMSQNTSELISEIR